MKRSLFARFARRIAAPLSGLMLAILPVPIIAQSTEDAHSAATAGYDRAHEITLNGTIEEVITEPAAGSPVGLHIMVAGPQGTVDAHLGPYLTKETREALLAGTPIQIVGAMETLHGKEYLLARQVIFSGRLVRVRTENGFLLQMPSPGAGHRGAAKTSPFGSNGGGR